jgi:hypothetical protein
MESNASGYEQEFRLVRDGQVTWIRESGSLTPIEGGRFWAVGVAVDVTESKHAQTARDEIVNRLRKLGSLLPGMIYQFRLRPDGSSWYSYGDMTSKSVVNSNPTAISGNFIKAVSQTTSTAGYAGISTYTAASGSQLLGLTTPATATYIKFDANSNGYTGTQLQVNLGDAASNNFNRVINVNWTGWQTVTIKLSDFYFGYGTDASKVVDPTQITTVKFHFNNYVGNQSEVNLDNIRFTY